MKRKTPFQYAVSAILLISMVFIATSCSGPEENTTEIEREPYHNETRSETTPYEQDKPEGYETWIEEYGWYVPTVDGLLATGWTAQTFFPDGNTASYMLSLYGNADEYSGYAGEAIFRWCYDGDREMQEEYNGWWNFVERDGKAFLHLEIGRISGIQYQDGEEWKIICNEYPILMHQETGCLLILKGDQEDLLPLWKENENYAILSKAEVSQPESGGMTDGSERTDPETSPDGGTANVKAEWAQDVQEGLSDCDRYIPNDTEWQVLIVFSSESTVKDFTVLALSFEEFSDDGKAIFSKEELYNHGILEPEHPFVAGMTFMGSIPNNGISYVGDDGITRYFAVEESGYDGSLLLSEIQCK